MSRRTELMLRSESVTQKRFRFLLQNATKGTHYLTYTPDGWDKGKFQIIRHEKWHGLFTKLSINELTFVKDGRDYIRDCYEAEGINSLVTFTVYRLNDTDQEYDVYFEGKLDMSTYMIDETGVKIQIIDDSFTEKIKNRETTKVNIRQRTSIGGFECTPFASENPDLNLPAYEVFAIDTWTTNTPDNSTSDDHFVPMLLNTSEHTEAQSQTIGSTDPFFLDSTAARTMTMTGSIEGLLITNDPDAVFTIRIYLKVNGAAVATVFSANDKFKDDYVIQATIDETFTIALGDDVSLETNIIGLTSPETIYYVVSISLNESIQSIPASTITAYPIYEAILRVCQLIGDKDDALRSPFFGRTDTPIYTYPSDGELIHISKGLYIRRAWGLNDTLSLSFADLFDSMKKIYCVAMGIESGRVVIDGVSEWFDNNVIIDLSTVIREETIAKEVLPTWHYKQIKSGYNSYEYLSTGGLSEYNTQSEFSTIIFAVDNDLDIVSRYRADTQGINKLRLDGPNSEDGKGDENIFLIDAVRDNLLGFIARTDEGFTLVTGGIDAGQSYNLNITPGRNLRRWGRFIRAGMEHYLSSLIRWQATDKNTTLQTQLSTEADPVDEDADITTNDLLTPYWYPEAYTVECNLRYDQISTILSNPKGLIKLASGKYGWILEFSIGTKEDKCELKLLRCNTNYVTPIEI